MAGFRDLAANLAKLDGIPSRIAAEVAGEINASIQDQFSGGADPYGKPWKPLLPQTVRRKGGDSRILMRTDSLAGETTAKPAAGAGIEITSIDYGNFHQTGTKHMVPRKILPDGDELPETWTNAIQTATENAFKKALG